VTPAPAVTQFAIRATGLTKRYGIVTALDALDLAVPEGSVFGLLGPNGAGKTTAFRLLTGLARPSSGAAEVAGVPVGGTEPTALRRRIGVLEQDPRYYSWMTGRELLIFAGRLHGLAGQDLRARVDETLGLVGLTEAANRRIGGYSGGMRQRIGIGQALVARPPVLILDEPVSSLDPEGRRDLLALIATLRGRSTILFSTHVLADVERVCDRVAILNLGRLLAEAPLPELLERYAQPVYRLEAEAGQQAAMVVLSGRLRGASWVRSVSVDGDSLEVVARDREAAQRELLPAALAEGVVLAAFERQRPNLEDVFLRIVAEGRAEPGP
jgi:ABC-2 type transport system ATP-binding protein